MKKKLCVLSMLLLVAMFGSTNMASAAFTTGFAYYDYEGTFGEWAADYDTNIVVGLYEYGYTYVECFNSIGETILDGSYGVYYESLSLGNGGYGDEWVGTSGVKLEDYWYVGSYQFVEASIVCTAWLQGSAIAQID